MTLTRPEETFVRSDADLLRTWRNLMGPFGFSKRSLWLIFIDEDSSVLPTILPIDGIPVEPDERMVRNLAMIVRESIRQTSPTCVALLLSRPGKGVVLKNDRRWAAHLKATFDETLMPWSIHLATNDGIQRLAVDE
ncbi:hypothetical protein [Branchiibius hedensis]|nr:hypothetical protein [Branchiibius hedensis]